MISLNLKKEQKVFFEAQIVFLQSKFIEYTVWFCCIRTIWIEIFCYGPAPSMTSCFTSKLAYAKL